MRRKTDSEAENNYTGRALTKRDIAIQLAEKFDINQLDATKIVQSVLDQIIASLEKGQHVEFREFGVFEVVVRKARIGRNPNKPDETVEIPEHRSVKFKPGKHIRDMFGGK